MYVGINNVYKEKFISAPDIQRRLGFKVTCKRSGNLAQ